MQRETLHKGIVIKLLTDYSNVPAGTWATVDSTGTMRDGAWWFTVRWHDYRPIPERFPHIVIEYSLNLWEPRFSTVPGRIRRRTTGSWGDEATGLAFTKSPFS